MFGNLKNINRKKFKFLKVNKLNYGLYQLQCWQYCNSRTKITIRALLKTSNQDKTKITSPAV